MYLFGLLPTLLCFIDAHHYAALDTLRWPKTRNQHVPAWQLWLLRMQMFVMYQISGIKKAVSPEWFLGFSQAPMVRTMTALVLQYLPFISRLYLEPFLSFAVHGGGLIFDLSIAALLATPGRSRMLAVVFAALFHGMTWVIYDIGMFPQACLALLALWGCPDWPEQLLQRWFPSKKLKPRPRKAHKAAVLAKADHYQINATGCCYGPVLLDSTGRHIASDTGQVPEGYLGMPQLLPVKRTSKSEMNLRIGWRHQACVLAVLLYLCVQAFIPFSHFITLGNNAWNR